MVQRIQLLASSIVPTVQWYYDEIHFSICILTLTLTLVQPDPLLLWVGSVHKTKDANVTQCQCSAVGFQISQTVNNAGVFHN